MVVKSDAEHMPVQEWNHLSVSIGIFGSNDLGQKYQAPQVRADRGSNSRPPDHDSTFHVTETPALITWPSVTSIGTLGSLPSFNYGLFSFSPHAFL